MSGPIALLTSLPPCAKLVKTAVSVCRKWNNFVTFSSCSGSCFMTGEFREIVEIFMLVIVLVLPLNPPSSPLSAKLRECFIVERQLLSSNEVEIFLRCHGTTINCTTRATRIIADRLIANDNQTGILSMPRTVEQKSIICGEDMFKYKHTFRTIESDTQDVDEYCEAIDDGQCEEATFEGVFGM